MCERNFCSTNAHSSRDVATGGGGGAGVSVLSQSHDVSKQEEKSVIFWNYGIFCWVDPLEEFYSLRNVERAIINNCFKQTPASESPTLIYSLG